jgi:hypothetical protein
MNTIKEQDRFEKQGSFVYDLGLQDFIISTREKIIQVFNLASRFNGGPTIFNDEDIINLYRSDQRDLWVTAYDQLRLIPNMSYFANHPAIIKTLQERCGIKFPVLAGPISIRANMPNDESNKFPPHQDYPYNNGSLNSITLWMPFQDVEGDLGPLDVIHGSHKEGLMNTTSDGRMIKILKDHRDESEYASINMKVGEALIFNQFVIHRSGNNNSNRILFSLQLRYNDLDDAEFAKRRYFVAHSGI